MKKHRYLGFLFLLICFAGLNAQTPVEIKVLAGKPVAEIQPTMWGVFFEDINFAADGGIYAELVKNRSFEFSLPLMGWRQVRDEGSGRFIPTFYSPANEANPRYISVIIDSGKGAIGLVNEGFRGMGIREGSRYNFSVKARVSPGSELKMRAELLNSKGESLGSSELSGFTQNWNTYLASITSSGTELKASLKILFTGTGSADIDLVSLFPADTWRGRPGGLRNDLVQMIADLQPGFMRFPGGCIVEGRDLTNRYQWKNTVGPVDARKMIINRWNMEIRDRQAPDYFQTFGLGFYEYFLLAEDLGAEPLPILNCGMSCQFNAAEVVPLNELYPYIQDALDLIEFANGPQSGKWGALRAAMGHPVPFNLKYIGVGNEQWEEQYIERYKVFEKVLKEFHPEIKIVSGSGPSASGRYFDYAWTELKKLSPHLIDEHYYMPPDWFQNNAGRYDTYDRAGIKVFAGEYAAHGRSTAEPESRNSWLSALSEAAFMTGLERNAGVVTMASYAPLLAHVDAWQWRPDLIWFDNLSVIGTPNYYVQKLFSTYRGTHVINAFRDGKAVNGGDSLYASAAIDRTSGRLFIRIVNTSSTEKTLHFTIEGTRVLDEGQMEVLRSDKLSDFNSVNEPKKIYPSVKAVRLKGGKLDSKISSWSVNVIVLGIKG